MVTETSPRSAPAWGRPREVPDPEPRPRLVVAGGMGRLGSAIVTGARGRGFPVVALIGGPARARVDRDAWEESRRGNPPILPCSQIGLALGGADVYIGASTPTGERTNLPAVAAHGVPAVVATTGLDGDAARVLQEVARSVPVVVDANFSVGAHLLQRLARAIGPLPPGYDLTISEYHRRGKRDRPSGTAVDLARALEGSGAPAWGPAEGRRTPGRVEIASMRGGETPGQHTLWVAGPHEMLRFEHWAFGREAFVGGILAASAWLADSRERGVLPGLYSLDDVLALPPAVGGR